MKTFVYFFVIAMLILSGCSKEMLTDETVNLKRAKVPVPMKADFCSTPDLTSTPILIPVPGLDPTDPKNYLPSKMFISGHATQMGEVITEKSWFVTTSLTFGVVGGVPCLIQEGNGLMTANNGDNYPITASTTTSLLDWTYVGEVTMFSGTGKFEGASGKVTMIGQVDRVAGTNCWKGDGFMKYK
jgi:hypothetical protein